MNAPRLTVLLAVRNGELFLRAAIESILRQTYEDFRFLIIDDASTDRTRDIIRSCQDRRLDLLCLDHNVGQTAALAIGVDQISTPWIARMDADDYSSPNRLQEQISLLESDPAIGCVGTNAWIFRKDPAIAESIIIRPETHEDIKRALLWECPVIHGSIVVSRSALLEAGGYDRRYRYSADLDLYDRLIQRCRIANINKPLLGIRLQDGQGSRSQIAIEEIIQIYSERSASGRYTPAEIAILRKSLSLKFLLKARTSLQHTHLGYFAANVGRAFSLSPKTVLRYCLPHRLRNNYSLRQWKLGERRFNPPMVL
jgi:glycosyltransferase involved in cell wall biosynthesis